MRGIFSSFEGHRNPPETTTDESKMTNGDQIISVPADEVLPVTKVPALDTIDQYAVERVAGEAANSPAIELSCDAGSQDVAKGIMQAYARFVSHFTGLEDVAFAISRDSSYVSTESRRAVVCASVFADSEAGKTCNLREASYARLNKDEVQFALELRNAEPENGDQHAGSEDVRFRSTPKLGIVLTAPSHLLYLRSQAQGIAPGNSASHTPND
ncbi:uncharacterized protein ACHE_30036A [Aspergillus chevalieri]|uniref:Uncharacterized protein n=1 Tax=Aspergillus chevalieri TaxID=182096 RepID=A0A7R7VLE5_ASPCH|nr:uncharacterized protein ACHE_30036A [Aspergillus chevalieri]BCR86049.1 hypothetical protein ACHE_30036A [Aspergillus chevalieri]